MEVQNLAIQGRLTSGNEHDDKSLREHTTGRQFQDRTALVPTDSNTTITYLFLTFDLCLPEPNTIHDSIEPLPPCPDNRLDTHPHHWPTARKGIMLLLCCIATFATAYAAGAYSPPASLMAEEFGVSRTAVLAGITTYTVGFGVVPMVLAPLSETSGRYVVFVVSGVVYVLFQAACGLVTSLTGMLIARLLCGSGASVFSSMVGGVIADLWPKEDRNLPMSLFSGAVLVGTGLGPLVASVMVQRWGQPPHVTSGIAAPWRWVFWHQVIFNSILVISIASCFHESRSNVLLRRRAKKLNRWYEMLEEKGAYGVWIPRDFPKAGCELETEKSASLCTDLRAQPNSAAQLSHQEMVTRGFQLQRIRWRVEEDQDALPISKNIIVSVIRPFHLLLTEPVVFFFSMWVSFAWAVLYLTFGSIPFVFTRQYGFNSEQSGLVFTAMVVGSILATLLGHLQEKALQHPKWQPKADGSYCDDDGRSAFWAFMQRRFPADVPEARLYFSCIGSLLLPLGLYVLGFAARPSVHWMVPSIALAVATMGIFVVYLATFNYLADIYQSYASSALASQSFCRNILGGAFPLVVTPVFTNLGQSAACGLLGAIATALTVVPWVLVFNGEKIRSRSRFAIVSCFRWSASMLSLIP